ncbi:hypothetical protein UPYG_G00171140 [Umbra pygmaea]|uniref:Fibronectin type-III domain-containing protein n=1 Tax=Umbra pygmaea TaxID=75934 RepID=A0ABD0WTM8_UMBPY
MLEPLSSSWIDQSESNSTVIKSQTNTAVIRGLKPGGIYVFLVRARTVAGFGRYSGKLYFQTVTEEEYNASIQEKLPLIIGSAAACLVFLIAVVVIIIVCNRRGFERADSEYTDKLQHYTSGHSEYRMLLPHRTCLTHTNTHSVTPVSMATGSHTT